MRELIRHILREELSEQKKSKYTEDEIRQRALQFQTPADFFKNDLAAYTAAQRFGILDDVMSHMKRVRKLTPELIKNIAKEYSTRREFELGDSSAYQKAHKLGIFDEVTSHMEKKFTNWTYDDAKQIASQYDNLKKFTDEQPNAANVIYRNKWNDLLTHMERGFKWWTDDEIIQDASKYGSRSEWQKNSGSAYNAALSRGM